MKTLLPLFILLCVTASYSSAAEGGVHGRVYGQDEYGENLGPIAGARIELKGDAGGAAASATTNEFGYYQIATLAAGAYRYKVTAPGYLTEDEQRGFAMPENTLEFVHDFLVSREPKPGAQPGPGQAQVVQPAVHGRVYGQNEKGENLGPLPGAKVELLAGPGGKVVASVTANSPGAYYEIKNLSPTDYAYRVSAAGFSTEDAGRGFTVPKATLEYVHDFLLSKPPPKRYNCELAILVVKRIGSGRAPENDVRVPVPNARVVLQPTTNQQTPVNQPFVTDAKGEHRAKDLPEGGYTVAIDAPECEPFTGALTVSCDKDGDVIFEIKPCNELLHGYVRALLKDGWGPGAQTKGAADRAYQRALKADDKDCSVNYALALAQLSAGDYKAGQQSLSAAIGKKRDGIPWDRACEARLWMHLLQHEPTQAVKEIRSLVQNHYGSRPATAASKDTAHVCGIALGLIKGPWRDQVGAGEAALLENELMGTLKGDLQAECGKSRDHVMAEYGKIKAAEDAARNRLMTDVTTKRNAEVASMAERQTKISGDVAIIDREIQTLQATVNEFDQKFRVQIAGFAQQRQALAAQSAPLNARLQQITACMAQDQLKYQNAAAQQQQQPQVGQDTRLSPTGQPGMRPGMMQPGAGAQVILAEMQQHQVEIQQIQAQLGVMQRQDAQMGAQQANLQNQFNASAGTAQASLNTKLRQREALATEYDSLDRQRTAPFDPNSFSTPEIDSLVNQGRSVKTYGDLPLESRREELLDLFDCGAAKEPQRPGATGRPAVITEPPFKDAPRARPASTRAMNPSATSAPSLPRPAGMMPAPAAPPPIPADTGIGAGAGMPAPPARPALPASATAVRPPPKVGEAAEMVISNNLPNAVRLFGVAVGSDNEQFVRSLQVGEEAMISTSVGQTFIIRSATGGQEVQRHKVGKKMEVLKLGAPRQE